MRSLKWRLNTLLPYKIWRWIYCPIRCKVGRHWTANNEWGFGGAVIDWYCPGCQKVVAQTPLDDATDAERGRVHELLEEFGVPGIDS